MKRIASIILASILIILSSCGSDDEDKVPYKKLIIGVWEVTSHEKSTIDFAGRLKSKEIINLTDGTFTTHKSDGTPDVKNISEKSMCENKIKYKFLPSSLTVTKKEFKDDQCEDKSEDTTKWSINEDDNILEFYGHKFTISMNADEMVLTEETEVKGGDYKEKRNIRIELSKISGK